MLIKSEKMFVEIIVLRLANRKKYRYNMVVETPEDYYRIFFIIFINTIVIQQLNDHFNNHKEVISSY